MDEDTYPQTFNEFSLFVTSVVKREILGRIFQNSYPYFLNENRLFFLDNNPPQLDVIILQLALYHDLLEWERIDNIKEILSFMKSISFASETKKLIPIQIFVDRVSELFMDQLNILYLILKSTSSLKELIDIGNQLPANATHYTSISRIIHDLKLEQLFSEIDDYCESLHSENKIISSAFDRLQVFSSYLVDIHNNIVGIKNDVVSIPLRLLHSDNILSNLSVFNTIIPAMELDEGTNLSEQRGMDLFFKSIPKIFSLEPKMMKIAKDNPKLLVKIIPLDNDHSFMGFGESLLSKSLITELCDHLKNHDLYDISGKVSHHRVIIANILSKHDKIFYEHECEGSPLLVLIPLFDDYLNEPAFFKIINGNRRYFTDSDHFWNAINKYVKGKKNIPKFKTKIPSFRRAQEIFESILNIALCSSDKFDFLNELKDLDTKIANIP